jgi:hypothetical protein
MLLSILNSELLSGSSSTIKILFFIDIQDRFVQVGIFVLVKTAYDF